MIKASIPVRLCLTAMFTSHMIVLHAESSQPNVLFLAVDDMNDWVGCLKTTPHAITPAIDRLAARGVSFTNAHTAGVFCAPSRAAVFSGQYASTTGCYQTPNYFVGHPEIEALQMSFMKAGYTTLGAGKLFLDTNIVPVRGQLTLLKPQAEINYSYLAANPLSTLYMFPRETSIVLGGTRERGKTHLSIDEDTVERMLREHGEMAEYA